MPASNRPPDVRRAVVVVVVALLAIVLATSVGDDGARPRGRASTRPFPGSWFTQPLPDDTPSHPREAALLAYLRGGPGNGDHVRLALGRWAIPIARAGAGDPERRIEPLGAFDPPLWQHMRIPPGARPAPNEDAELVVWDVDRGVVAHLFGARLEGGSWAARGGSVAHLGSNGLDARVAGHDDVRNVGTSRGNNGLTFGITWDEVQAGAVGHVVKVAVGPETSARWVWPMWGSDGDATDPDAPPQGLRLRLRPDLDLEDLGLHGEALVIARGLQRYGMYVGDNGGRTSIKLEADRTWQVRADALVALPLDPEFWQVLPEGWGAPAPG